MASWVLSECCGLKPLPLTSRVPKLRCPQSVSSIAPKKNLLACRPITGLGTGAIQRDWALHVSAPLKFPQLEEENNSWINQVQSSEERNDEFDPGMPPPFSLADIRAAIPKHCWVKNPWKSMSYVVRDVAIVFGLAAVAAYLNNWLVWPLYWIAQGTMFWALFVLGHDWYRQNFCFFELLSSLLGAR
jgi:acyl-lipid omega-3 desaturase